MSNKTLTIFDSGFKKTIFANEYKFYIHESLIDDVNFETIKEILLFKEKEIIERYPNTNTDGNTGLGFNSLTSKFEHFNVFSWNEPEIQKLKQGVSEQLHFFFNKLMINVPEGLKVQCWANIMRHGEQILPHVHDISNNTYVSGHIGITTNETQTHYINPMKYFSGDEQEIYSSDNKMGKVTFFSQNVPHFTDKVKEELRISIAFDFTRPGHGRYEHKNLVYLDNR